MSVDVDNTALSQQRFGFIWFGLVLFGEPMRWLVICLFYTNDYLVGLGPEPAFGRLGLGGSPGGYSSHG